MCNDLEIPTIISLETSRMLYLAPKGWAVKSQLGQTIWLHSEVDFRPRNESISYLSGAYEIISVQEGTQVLGELYSRTFFPLKYPDGEFLVATCRKNDGVKGNLNRLGVHCLTPL